MKAVAQAFTFKELDAIRSALSIILQHKEQLLPLATKSMETALKKVDRVIDDTHYQQSKNLYFLVIPMSKAFTFKELDTIRSALLVAEKADLPIDTEPMKEALHKIDGILDKWCRTGQYSSSTFALLPLLAKNDEE